MKKHFQPIQIMAAMLMLLFISAAQLHAQSAAPVNLDGKTFVLKLTDDQDKPYTDEITFQQHTFSCNAIKNSTFANTRYAAQNDANGKLFLLATAVSETEGTMTWKGHIDGNTIEGGVIIEKPGQQPTKHMFKGETKAESNE